MRLCALANAGAKVDSIARRYLDEFGAEIGEDHGTARPARYRASSRTRSLFQTAAAPATASAAFLSVQQPSRGSVGLARVVLLVDVSDPGRSDPVALDHGFLGGPGVVVHALR